MNFDALIIGSGVAGTASAILLRQLGWRVRVCESKSGPQHYKKLCTHFIQPAAMPVLHRLGLAELAEPMHSVRTQATFITDSGSIDSEHGYGADGQGFALNLERSVFDPALRRQANANDIEIGYGERVTQVQRSADGWAVTVMRDGQPREFTCRLLVAADGRNSTMASLLGNPCEEHENQRATFFAYCHGIAAPAQHRSLFALHRQGMAFLYPLVGERTLLSAYIDKTTAKAWQAGDSQSALIEYFASVPGMPALDQVVFETPIYGYQDYPSRLRQPVYQDVAFVGDAALSLDPMSGVGCSFALLSAALLADSVAPVDPSNAAAEPASWHAYAHSFQAFFPAHARGIIADSRIVKEDAVQQAVYRTIIDDPLLQRRYLDLTGRLITPAAFQSAFLLSKIRQRSALEKAPVTPDHPPEEPAHASL